MKIIRLAAENFKRLVAVEIKPDGNTVILSGKNGAGKSSVLDAIVAALCGGKALPQKPIRDGQNNAQIELETEEYTVKRSFTNRGSTLTITGKDGAKFASPQAMLDKIVGKIAFDPMSFSRQDAKEQRKILMDLVGVNFEDIDKKIVELRGDRAVANKLKDEHQHEANRITYESGTPDTIIELAQVAKTLQEATNHNNIITEQTTQILALKMEIKAATGHMQDLVNRIKELTDHHSQIKNDRNAKKAESERLAGAMKQPIDVEGISDRLANAEKINTNVRLKQQKEIHTQEALAAADTFSRLGQEMKEAEATKAKLLSEVKMPVEGLSVEADCVTYNGIPLAQVNSAKMIEIGVAVSMAMNPELRVLRMDGNNLDTDSLADISKMVEDKD